MMNEIWRIVFRQLHDLFLEQSKINYLIRFGLASFPDSNIERGYLRRHEYFKKCAEQDKRADLHRESTAFKGHFHRTFYETRTPLVGWDFEEFGYGAIWGDERGVSQFLNLANQAGTALPSDFVPDDDPLFPPIEPCKENWSFPDTISRWLHFVYVMQGTGFGRISQLGQEYRDGELIDLAGIRIAICNCDPFLLSASVIHIALSMDSSALTKEYDILLRRKRLRLAGASSLLTDEMFTYKDTRIEEIHRLDTALTVANQRLMDMLPETLGAIRLEGLAKYEHVATWCDDARRICSEVGIEQSSYDSIIASVKHHYRSVYAAIGSAMTFEHKEWEQLVIATRPLIEGLHHLEADIASRISSRRTTPASRSPIEHTREGAPEPPPDPLPASTEAETCESDSLGDREEHILREMYGAQIFTHTGRLTRAEIVAKCQKNANPDTWNRNFSKLTKLEYLDSQTGPGGGCWLTAKGKKYAEKLMS